jgi:sec-independent protein translocase protein TatC
MVTGPPGAISHSIPVTITVNYDNNLAKGAHMCALVSRIRGFPWLTPLSFVPAQDTYSMPLMAHLEELGKRIIFSVLGVIVGFLACWSYADRIFFLVQQPLIRGLQHHGLRGGLVYLNPTEPFNLYLEVGFVAGLFTASPFVFYQLWLFIAPGLYRKEKRYVLPFLLNTVGLFIAGGFFGYKMVYPASLDLLIGYGLRFQPMITIAEYTKLFLAITIGLGLIFEMPILVCFLALMRVISARWMW